ncbi:hypothetical protein [Tenacibaculum sp. Bg11-29]|uniref:hypothetical protein n=1 Tax=Tenacibaculum sp. Bg11-29 TaxID=2058306 RepID=UPI0012FE9E2B|nr:hypothetical protein [Tenacibaculum sp. Bg11-29]
MNTTEKHLKTRTITFVIIFIVFISLGYLLMVDFNLASFSKSQPNYQVNRSCLGNPVLLPYAFIGFPLIIFLGIVDVLTLTILKKITLKKLIINFLILLFSFLLTLILPW